MSEQFLFQQLDAASNLGLLSNEIPDSITQNLNPVYELRDYQIDAFARFIHCPNNNFPGKENPYIYFSTWQQAAANAHHSWLNPLPIW